MKPIFRSPSEVKEGEIYMAENPGGPPHFLRKGNAVTPPEEVYDHNLISELRNGTSRRAVEWRSLNFKSDFFEWGHLAEISTEQRQQQAHQRPIPDNVRQFVLKHYAEAQTLANSLGNGVTAAEMLAIAGNETHWGSLNPKDGFARFGNFFGLHGHGPAGTYRTKDNHQPTPKFPIGKDDDGFKASGQAFVKLVLQKGLITPDIGADPRDFFNALNKAAILAAPDPHYADKMVGISPRGQYEAVKKCIEQLKQEGKL